ncbi:GntR family transcriptional regulator [Dongia soli]|uniref:GntR family transcriptional regulator n=1 Tax=Dongia soli TaxID=600628 RepID=A0ABU5EFQ6_9PROT|nr:GntR family transcriptional regulator [Dongia soli]MDY0884436.1 GntR family transcriptional regulator [Dongia soli]
MRAPRKTLRASVYESLKGMIVTGDLQPGTRVTESELAERLNVSRTPVREALNRLEQDGLVVGRPRQGYTVKDFDLHTFREAFEIRELLDGYAAELATANIDAAGKERLRGMVQECERLAALSDHSTEAMFAELQLGIDIHRVIAEIGGNETLCQVLSGLFDKCQHYVWMELLWLDEWKAARDEHMEIVEAICNGKASLAGELARKHVQGSRNNILRLLQTKTAYRTFLARAS